MPLREDLENGEPLGLPPFLIRDGRGGNEWMPAEGNDPNRALPFAILPFSEMPQVINPPRGFIVNANNDPTGNSRDNNVLNVLRPTGGIRYIGSGYSFDLGIRAGRIEQLLTSFLASGQKLGVQDLQRIQADVVMGDATFFVPFIVRALGNALRPDAPVRVEELLQGIRASSRQSPGWRCGTAARPPASSRASTPAIRMASAPSRTSWKSPTASRPPSTRSGAIRSSITP